MVSPLKEIAWYVFRLRRQDVTKPSRGRYSARGLFDGLRQREDIRNRTGYAVLRVDF